MCFAGTHKKSTEKSRLNTLAVHLGQIRTVPSRQNQDLMCVCRELIGFMMSRIVSIAWPYTENTKLILVCDWSDQTWIQTNADKKISGFNHDSPVSEQGQSRKSQTHIQGDPS